MAKHICRIKKDMQGLADPIKDMGVHQIQVSIHLRFDQIGIQVAI